MCEPLTCLTSIPNFEGQCNHYSQCGNEMSKVKIWLVTFSKSVLSSHLPHPQAPACATSFYKVIMDSERSDFEVLFRGEKPGSVGNILPQEIRSKGALSAHLSQAPICVKSIADKDD